MKYIILAIHPQTGAPVPIMTGEDVAEELALFASRVEAESVAKDNPLCAAGGFEIIAWRHYV